MLAESAESGVTPGAKRSARLPVALKSDGVRNVSTMANKISANGRTSAAVQMASLTERNRPSESYSGSTKRRTSQTARSGCHPVEIRYPKDDTNNEKMIGALRSPSMPFTANADPHERE